MMKTINWLLNKLGETISDLVNLWSVAILSNTYLDAFTSKTLDYNVFNIQFFDNEKVNCLR